MGKTVQIGVAEINRLARALHGSDAAATAYTFKSLREHVDEVEALFIAQDGHWRAETVDIIIHGLTLLQRAGVGQDEMDVLMVRRLARFKEKIAAARHEHAAGDDA